MTTGALTLRTYPLDLVRIARDRCGRQGQYQRARLLDRFGPDLSMPDVLGCVTECLRRGNASDPCHALYPDLVDRSMTASLSSSKDG